MTDVLRTLAPLFLFMLIPVWIPIIAVVVGSVLDRLTPAEEDGYAARHRRAALPEPLI